MKMFWMCILSLALTVNAAAPDVVENSGAVECANLIYAGTKSSVCFSEEFLSALARETSVNTSRKFKPVKLSEREVYRFPFAVMTGEGAFSFTEDERKNVKTYLEKGGFLLASAGCSSREWGDSFSHEMEALFPDKKMSELSMSHPIFYTPFFLLILLPQPTKNQKKTHLCVCTHR